MTHNIDGIVSVIRDKIKENLTGMRSDTYFANEVRNYYNANIRQLDDEDARKLYVAITRARKRLCISVSTKRIRFNGMVTPISPSRFLIPVVDKLTN